MPLSEHVLADYQMLRLSLRAHLMFFLRDSSAAEGVLLPRHSDMPHRWSACCLRRLVLTRQMPGDAGVVFVTLSDETSVANVVICPIGRELPPRDMGAKLLLIEGKVQRSPEGVVHLVADAYF